MAIEADTIKLPMEIQADRWVRPIVGPVELVNTRIVKMKPKTNPKPFTNGCSTQTPAYTASGNRTAPNSMPAR